MHSTKHVSRVPEHLVASKSHPVLDLSLLENLLAVLGTNSLQYEIKGKGQGSSLRWGTCGQQQLLGSHRFPISGIRVKRVPCLSQQIQCLEVEASFAHDPDQSIY